MAISNSTLVYTMLTDVTVMQGPQAMNRRLVRRVA
jgi:hypothetical protein